MSTDKIRIALLTVWYPPKKGVAVNRMVAFVNYLAEINGVSVSVFTQGEGFIKPKNKSIQIYSSRPSKIHQIVQNRTTDSKLVHKIRTAIKVIYLRLFGNEYTSWKKDILNQIIHVHKEKPFDVILSSYAPEEVHEVAIQFLKLGYKVPWIADMRDEMSLNPGISSQLKSKLEIIEKQVNLLASGITSVSLPILNDFRKICPEVLYFEEIRNGYDHNLKFNYTSNNIFTIGYFGSFYGSIKPTNFFAALVLFHEEFPNYFFKVELYGVHNNFNIPSQLVNFVQSYEALAYENAIERMSTMDVNLLLLPNEDRKGVYSGKLFDYISVRKPILACIDPSDVASELIHTLDCGYIVDFNNVNQIKNAILEAYHDWEKGFIKKATEEEVNNLHRKVQVSKLYRFIENVIA